MKILWIAFRFISHPCFSHRISCGSISFSCHVCFRFRFYSHSVVSASTFFFFFFHVHFMKTNLRRNDVWMKGKHMPQWWIRMHDADEDAPENRKKRFRLKSFVVFDIQIGIYTSKYVLGHWVNIEHWTVNSEQWTLHCELRIDRNTHT